MAAAFEERMNAQEHGSSVQSGPSTVIRNRIQHENNRNKKIRAICKAHVFCATKSDEIARNNEGEREKAGWLSNKGCEFFCCKTETEQKSGRS